MTDKKETPKKALSTAEKLEALIKLMRANGWSIPDELDA